MVPAQVGKAGRAVGIEVKRPAMVLGRNSVQALMRASSEFAATAAPTRFYLHNVFIPSLRHKARSPRFKTAVHASSSR